MIEKIVLNHLSERLSWPVFMEEPTDKPARYVLIEKTGSNQLNKGLYSATIAIKTIAESLYQAAADNLEVIEAMDSIIIHDDVCRCELNSDYNYTDTTTKRYRYQSVWDLVHYGGGN